jgi:hypothetical protein
VQQRSPNSIAARLLRDFAPAVDPTSGFRDLGSPAPGAGIGPADGIMDVGSAFFVPEGWRRGNQFNARADYELRPGKDRLYGNFYRTNSYAVTGGVRPEFNRPTPNTTHYWNVNYTKTFSSSRLNEVRVGMMRLVGLPDVPRHLEIPGINIQGGVSGFGQSGYPNGWWQTNWHLKDIFTVVKSSHLIKMGGELRQMYGSASNTNNYIPNYTFSNLLNFADDEALQVQRYVDPRTGEPVTAFSELTQTEWALFIDDDWKVTRNLTINMGLRYENYGTFKDSDDTLRNIVLGQGSTIFEQIGNARVDFVDEFFAADNNNIGPRLGFAWDPKGDGKMSVRGGYGLAFDRLMNLPAENYRHSPPLRASVILGQQFGTPNFTYSLGDASRPYLGYPVDSALQVGLDDRNGIRGARVALTVVDPDLKSPYTHNWFAGVQREIPLGIVAELNYLGSAGRQLHNAYNVNRFVGDLATDNTFTGFNPSFAGITMVRSNSRANFHGGTFTLRRNFKQGYMLQGAYTFGKAMNDADQAVGATAFQDAADIAADYAIAGYDVRHKLALVGLWEIPFFRNSTGLKQKLLGGWQLAGSAIMQTGNPINVTTTATFATGDFNGDGSGGDRPNAPTSGVKASGWSQEEYLAGIFRAADFPVPARGTNGNLVRNAYRGPGYADVSLSLSKRFQVTPKINTEVRIDAFNAFNRVNLSDPNMDLSNTNFGRSTSQLNTRAIQLGFRLRF